jgi:imidazolonepropionase-like amidohydrolase
MGLEDEIGNVEPGKQADLLVVEGDPSRDIRALRHVRRVFLAGIEVARDGAVLERADPSELFE